MNNQQSTLRDSVKLTELLTLIRKKLLIIVLSGLIFGAIGFSVSKFLISPTYEANASMIVITRTDSSAAVTNDQINSAENLVNTYAVIIQSRTVMETVIDNLNLDMGYKALQKRVSVSAINSTQVMQITVTMDSPETAQEILAEILKDAPDMIIESVESGSVKIIDQAAADYEPVAPNVSLNTIISVLIGIVISAVFIIGNYLLHNVYYSEEELFVDIGIPVLGVIPELGSVTVKRKKR